MLKKENSLRKKKEIDFVFKGGKAFYGDYFTFKFLKNNLNLNRFCIIISAKVIKKAVIRNKNRRQIKAIFFDLKPFLKEGFDCLFIVKSTFLDKNFSEKKDIIESSFNKIKFYK